MTFMLTAQEYPCYVHHDSFTELTTSIVYLLAFFTFQHNNTFPACVAAVKQGWTPSNLPIVTMRGLILWFSFRVKIGTNIVTLLKKQNTENITKVKNKTKL